VALARLVSMSPGLQARCPWVSLVTGLCFLVLVVASVPHRVHHFFEEFAPSPTQRTFDPHHRDAHDDGWFALRQSREADQY